MEDSRVRYSVDGDMYDIPSDKTAEFETARPQARQVYRVGEETYAIPLDKRDGFAAQHPDAQYYNGGYVNPDYAPAQAPQPAQEAQAAEPAPTPAPAQPEARKDGFFARLGRNLSQAESSPQGAGIPEPAVQQTQQKSELPADWRETSAEFDAGYDSAMGVINTRLEERSNALREQSMARERRMGRFLSSIYNAGQSENGAVVVPQAREEMQAGGDADSDELRAASQLYESAKRIKDAAYQRKGVAAGLSDSFRTDTWDFGVTDLKTARAVYGVAQKLERGEDLTENDNLLLDALVQNAFANDYYGGQLRRGYKAGQTTGESLPFMLEFIMNPLAGGQNAASGGAVKVLEKRLAKAIAKRAEKSALVSAEKTAMRAALDKGGTLLLKGVARSADDLASAAGMAATTGSLRTLGDTYSRKTGEVQFSEDPDGGLQFDGFKGGENSFWKAAAKAYGATTIENFSEMFGNYFSPVGQTAKKGLYFLNKKMGLQRVNDFIDGIGAADWARAAGDFLERTDWNGPIGEFGEEIAGGIMNALTVGDQTLSASDPNGVFNKDNLVDTFLGVALFGGVVSALKTAGYRTQMQRNEIHMSKADNAGKEVFGARWNPIKAMIDEADEQSLGAIISRAFDPGAGYTPDQMFIIGEYANGRMTQLGLEKGRKKREDYISEGEEEGRALTDPADINRMDIDSKYATEKAAREDEDGNGASADAELGVEHAEAVMRGRRDAVRSNIEAAVGQPFWRSETTSREQGEPAQEDVVDVITYADGREVYVMSDDGQGNLATVDAEGKKGFISEAELQDGQAQRTSMPLETYLDIKVGQQNADAERQRMAKDAADNLKAVRQRVQQEGRINVGTPEAEQMATVVAVDPAPNGGVTVQVEGEAQPRVVSWAEAAQSLDMPLAPKSNDEIVAERIDAEEETQRYNGGIAEDAELVVMMDGTPVAYQFRRAENIDGDVIIKAYDPSLGEEVDLTPEMVTNLGDLLNGGTPAMPVADVDGNPVPEAATPTQPVQIFDDEAANELGIPQEYAYTTKRGAVVVDGSRLWAENPALWAQWNDRNPNRVIPTREYLEGKLAEIGNEVQEARQNLEAEARGQQNPDRMDELQQVLDKKVARQREISGLAARYESTEQAAAEAAAPVAEEAAAAQAETAAPVMEEQTPSDAQPSITAGENATAEEIIASTQAVLDAIAQQPARNEEERRNAMEAKAEALQQMYDALGANNTVVTTMAGLVDTMKAAGASERTIAAVENKLEELRASRGTLEGFYDRGTDTIFMVADGLQTAEHADRINIHESKHYENARTQAHRIALSTGISRQEMVSVMRRYKRTIAYDADTRVSLSDEVLAVSAEIAEEEGIEAIPDRLRELGVTNEEFINFVKNNVDNGRRNGQRRHLERRAPLQPSVAEGIGGQDGRNRIAEPGDVGGSRIRPDERSEEGARSGEPAAEPAQSGESGEQPGTVELAEEPSADTASEEALMHEISAGMDGRMDVDGQNTPVNFSVTSIAGGAGLAATEQDESGNVAFVAPDGRIFNGRNPLTVADVKGDGNNILSYMVQDALRYGTITPERAETIWQKYTDTLNRMLAKGLAENGGFDNLSSQWQWVGETVYKTIHDNSDAQYKHSIDITRVCKKNEAVIKAISALQRRLGYGITPGQVLDIYRSSIEEGYQVPCPVCYVFSRYIGNGYIATIAINGQKKYGAQLVDPATLSEEEKKKRVRFWVNELEKVEADNERHKKTIAKAKSDIQFILDEIDGLSRKALAKETPAKERNRLLRQIKALDRRYKAALNVVSQSNLAKWIKNFAIHEVKGEWQLYDDTYQGMPAEYALDIRLTADAIRKYPGIQRMRKSLGSAGGKVIQFAADNTLGDVPMLLGHKENENAPNYYQMAVDAKSDEERASILKKASEQFGKAITYSQQQSLRGGQRMWSWSDNIERLAPDVFVNLMQEEMLGSALQSYSKQLEGINLVATMGGYVNGSLMGKGIGYQDVTEDQVEIVDGREVLKEDITDTVTEYTGEGTNERTRVLAQAGSPVFSDGTRRVVLVFDDIVGIDAYGRDGKKGLFSLNQSLDKAGNILVGMDDTHIRAAMADDRVFFIIPWHASGLSSHILTQMMDYLGVNMDGVKPQDYTSVQEEKEPKDGVVSAELAAFWEAHRTDYPSAFNIPSGRDGRLSQEQIDYRNLRDAIFDGRVEGNQQFMDAIARDEFLSQVYRKVKERVSEGKMTAGDKNFIYPYEYWDETSTYGTADVNGNRYLEYCRRLGIQPKFVGQLNDKAKKRFGNFADEKGYWKLLIDRRMYDTAGRFQDLTPVSTDNYTPDLVDPEVTEQEFNVTKVADDAGVERIADRTMATEEKRPGGIATVNYDMDLNSAVRAYESLDADEQEGPQFSVSEDSQRIFDAAKERFGTTRDIREAGYVLPDGEMLDFSGRHELAPGSDSSFLKGGRTVHREVESLAWDREGNEKTGIDTSMPDFIRRGAIRIDNNAGTINLAVKPTIDQRYVLQRLIENNDGTVDVDFGDGWDSNHYVSYDGAKSARVINDIKRYFDEGVEPEGGISFSLRGIVGAAEDATAMANLDTAQEMETAGKDAKTIWLATGWEKGTDGKWRNEIPDAKPKMFPVGKRKLTVGDIIDAPEIFASYPEIRGYKVTLKKSSSAGSFLPSRKEIELDSEYNSEITIREEDKEAAREYFAEQMRKDPTRPATLRKEMEKKFGVRRLDIVGISTVTHELQHAIQEIEGFARGGNSAGQAQDFLDKVYKDYPNVVNFLRLFSTRNTKAKLLSYGPAKIRSAVERGITDAEGEVRRRMEELRDYLAGIDDWKYRGLVNAAELLKSRAQQAGKVMYNSLAGEVEARNAERRRSMSEEERRNTPPSETEDVSREEQLVRFSVVTDQAKIEELENGEKELGYRTVTMNEDGSFGSPKASKLGKKGEKSVKTSSFNLNEWEQSEENPNLATEDGKINLADIGGVDYNPYIHIRPDAINKQFTSAWRHPEQVYIQTAYPTSELSSGYHADKAKLPVGRHAWTNGDLILSRWDKPERIVPWEEVADAWEQEFKDTGVTFDIVSPHLLPILAERGVEILPPKKAAGKPAMDAYERWKKEQETPRFSITGSERFSPEIRKEMDDIKAAAEANGTYLKAPNGNGTNLTPENWQLVRTQNFKNWFGDWESDPENASKVVDENGEPRVVYHGTRWNPLAEKPGKAVFDVDRVGDNFDFVDIDWNFFFTASKQSAEGYGRAVPVFLNIRNMEEHEIRERLSFTPDEEIGHDIVVTAHDAGSEYDEVKKVENPDGVVYTIRAVDTRESEQLFGEAIRNWEGEHRQEMDDRYNELANRQRELSRQIEDERRELFDKMNFQDVLNKTYDQMKAGMGYVLDQVIDDAAKVRNLPMDNLSELLKQFDEVDQQMFKIIQRVGIEGRPEYEDYEKYEREIVYKKSDIFALDDPNQIKSAVANNGEFSTENDDIRFSVANEHQEIFVSNAQRAVEGIRQDKATPEQWLKMIEKGGGLKAGEDKWLGLSDWLKGQDKKSITKQEILDYINENKIQIEEQPYSEDVDLEEAAKRLASETIAHGHSLDELQDEVDELKESPQRYDFVGEDADPEELDDYLMDAMVETYGDDFRNAYYIEDGVIDYYDINPYDVDEDDAADLTGENGERKINSTRLSYTTEGLENKREIALTVPTIEPWNQSDTIHFGDAGEGRAVAWIRFGDTTTERGTGEAPVRVMYAGAEPQDEAMRRAIEGILINWNDTENVMRHEDRENQFFVAKSMYENGLNDNMPSYTDEQRELAERTLESLESLKPDDFEAVYSGGKRVLFIDEIQSKRHQEGREHGYKDQKAIAALQDKEDEAKKAYDDYIDSLKEKYGGFDGMAGNLTEEENQRAEELNDAHIAAQNEVLNSIGSIPAAPFEKNWHELAMKRMLRLAAEEGYDYVAWTTGALQAERYNLSSRVDAIDYIKNEDGTYQLRAVSGGRSIILDSSLATPENKLADYVGKEIARKIVNGEGGMMNPYLPDKRLTGVDLRVGGEGMKGFYDDILPRFMNKYGKQWGVKVEDITLPGLENGNLSAHAVPVTQEMKDSVMEGQLMFSTSVEEQTNRQMLIEQAEKGGLGAVIGENGVAELYREAYASIPKEELKKIVERGLAEGGNVMGQLKAYLHEKAKQGTENDETGLLFKLFDDIRFVTANPALTDADIRWMLFKETSSARADDLLALAEERAMKNRWGVGAIPQEQQFQEATRQAAEDVAQRMEEAEKTREEAKTATASESVFSGEERSILNELKTIDKAMAGQQAYDKATVDSIVKFAREILKNGKVSALTLREVTRLLSLVNNAAGKSPKFVTRYADQLMDMLLDHVVADEKAKFMKLVKVNASKVSDSGVEVQGKLDVIGQAMIKAFRENMDSDVEDIRRRLEEVSDRITDKDDAIREEAQAAYQGLMMALQYKENIKENEASYKDLKDEFDDVGTKLVQLIGRKSYEQFITESKDALRKNRLERVDMYRDLSAQIADVIKGGAERAKAFREEQKKRVEDIHHDANRDMQGTPAREHLRDGRLQRFLNSDFVHFFAKSLATADQMFRLIGRKSVTGEGWLFNRLIKNGFTPCRDAAIRGLREATDILDRKASEVFGKKMRWSGIYDIERKMKGMTVTFLDGGEMVDHDLTQGNMLYIYMANKMADGRMKLRKMGISEEDVAEIKRHIDPRFIELADWMQNEFYVNLRNKYNAVHERMFGAPMAAIDDYVPLKILSNARFEDVDLGNNKSQAELSSTVTGSIIKRRKNSVALDILNTDAFSLAIEHVQKMEDWAAFAEFRRDMNTLLSYKRFRNQIQNMNTIYGSGETLWQTFFDACSVITGNYKPKVRRGDIDRIALNVSKGVTGAKIAFRVNTALKQILSFPAYFSDARPDFLAKSLATPGKSWRWCMENLPMFEDRWKGRIAGDTRLMNTDSSWEIWKNKMVERLSRWGMTPNAFIDATTVAIGSKAMYDTKRARYLRDGYSEEKADEMARRDAEILYNQTQQSSENAFVAPVQLDRTVMAVTLTTYRNSSMAYQRQLHDAIRSLRRMLKPGYREQSVEFMKRQHMENGLTEEQAELAAGREYNRQWYRNLVRVAMFGYGLQFLWKIGNNMWYLLFGDDDDEKQKILEDAALAELAGPVEGLVGGNVISDAWAAQASKLVNARYGIKEGNRFGGSGLAQLPIESDMDNIMSLMDYDKVRAINGIIDLVAQSVSGVNPQTITDIVVAVIDACNGDLDTATEAALLAMRILQMPQSTIDKFMIDEIDMSAADARKLSVDELARRYAEYKVRRNAPLTGWAYDDETREKRLKSQEKAFREKVKQRMQLKEGTEEEVPETTEEAYERITKAMQDIGRPVNQAKKDKDTLTMNMLMAQPQYEQYLIFKRYQKEINKLKRSIDNTQDDALREQWTAQREELIRKMTQEIENNQ